MKAAKAEAEDMEDEDDVETVLMMVAMTDEFALRRATDRAAKARAVLDSDIVKEAFDDARSDLHRCVDGDRPARDTDGRECCG